MVGCDGEVGADINRVALGILSRSYIYLRVTIYYLRVNILADLENSGFSAY